MIVLWIASSCLLILTVVALRAALGRRISARLRYALWLVVLFRLLVPVQLFTSPVVGMSVVPVEQTIRREETITTIPADPNDAVSPPNMPGAGVTAPDEAVGGDGAQQVPSVSFDWTAGLSRRPIVVIWILGAAILASVLAASNLRFYLQLRRMRRLLWMEGTLPVYAAEPLLSPCLFGVTHPSIYVTGAIAADPVMLRHVLNHELTHARHLDHIWSFLRAAVLAVHWWNPLVWLAATLSRRDGELACDEGALKRLGDRERLAYGETLLALVTAREKPGDLLSCATTMSGSKRSLRERIERIARKQKKLVSTAVAAIALLAIVALFAFGQRAEAADMLDCQPDLTHDGTPEVLRLLCDTDSKTLVVEQERKELWSGTAYDAHAGWDAWFLCQLEGKDYLLQYNPYMSNTGCSYRYRLFYLENGMEVVVQENQVQFDFDFTEDLSYRHQFDPAEIAAFLEEVNSLLAKSIELVNTDQNLMTAFQRTGELRDYPWWTEGDGFLWNEDMTTEENLRAYQFWATTQANPS